MSKNDLFVCVKAKRLLKSIKKNLLYIKTQTITKIMKN